MKDVYEFYVAGVKFHNLNQAIGEVSEGQFLEMVKEPDNKYDANAVKLIYRSLILKEKIMVGYVPGKISADITAFMEVANLQCEVTQVNPTEKPWTQLKVRISEVKGA